MRLWFEHSGEVSLKQQLATQITLAILAGELAPGDRLPSTRYLARRHQLHPNTVSAGYRQLQAEGWVELRHGSGVYVLPTPPQHVATPPAPLDLLTPLIQELLTHADHLGVSRQELRTHLLHLLDRRLPTQLVFVEPDPDLRSIALYELTRALDRPVHPLELTSNLDPAHLASRLAAEPAGTIVLALPTKAELVRRAVPAHLSFCPLVTQSFSPLLASWLPAPTDVLIVVVSSWPPFLDFARTVLVAAGFSPDALLFREAHHPTLESDLHHASAVVCDSLTATSLSHRRIIVSPLIASSCLAELRALLSTVGTPEKPY